MRRRLRGVGKAVPRAVEPPVCRHVRVVDRLPATGIPHLHCREIRPVEARRDGERVLLRIMGAVPLIPACAAIRLQKLVHAV